MKKFLFVFLSVFLLAAGLQAQVIAELGAITQAIMAETKIEQFVYYANMIKQQIESAVNTYNQFEATIRAEQRALENLKGIQNVSSFSDFMNWYNRQLSLEQRVEERYHGIGIQIGNQNYKLSEIEKIPGALSGTNVDYWDGEFSEAQRREMWLSLGLTPSNYVYQTTWKERNDDIARMILARRDLLEEDNDIAWEEQQDLLTVAGLESTGEKALLQSLLKITIDTNNVLRGLRLDTAEAEERRLAQDRLNNTPPSDPGLSDMWGAELFMPITDKPGRFIDKY